MKQRDAVYQAVVNVAGKQEGCAYTLSKEHKAQVHMILACGFVDGTIDHKRGKLSEDEAKEYVPGLVNNWLRKDERLNGGTKYEAKNPGSRSGSGDAQVKAMRMLLNTRSNPAEIAEIKACIERRLAEIKPTKTVVEVNVADLPVELRAKYGC